MLNQAALGTIDEMIDSSATLDADKLDFRVPANTLFFDEQFALHVDAPALAYDDVTANLPAYPGQERTLQHRVLDVTDAAAHQLYLKLGKTHFGKGGTRGLPGEYLDRFPAPERAQILNWTLSRSKDTLMVRSFGFVGRAFLDDLYPRIWNTDLLRQVRRVLDDKGELERTELARPFLDADQLHLKIWFPDTGGNNGNLKVGAVIRNGEVGNSSLDALAMVQRHSCANSIVVGLDAYGTPMGYSITHYPGASAAALMTQFYAALPSVMNASANIINRMIEAEGIALPDFQQILDGLAIEHGWQYRFKNLIGEGTEGQRTLMGLVNGITYAAHDSELSPAKVLDVEIIGGNLLYAPQPELARLIKQAELGKKVRA